MASLQKLANAMGRAFYSLLSVRPAPELLYGG